MPDFKVISEMTPKGDQPPAIDRLAANIMQGQPHNVLLGVTGSGKTFTMAHVVERVNKPTLVVSHNKTLAAQLYQEFKELFPENAVGYFVSYYDYYQPEAYIPQRDIYIEKDASRNDDLDRLRLSATSSLISRRDVVIVASVSCIFGLGSPEDYKASVLTIRVGQGTDRDEMLRKLVSLQYERCDVEFKRGTFRVRGDVVEIYPSYEEMVYRVEMFGDEIERIELVHPVSGESLASDKQVFVYPAVHYMMPEDRIEASVASIREELEARLWELKRQGKLLEAQRLAARTKYDIEMIMEVGYCPGIENYSRHLNGMPPGSRPYTLIDYFSDDYLLIIDECHATIPQLHAMHGGDRSRKQTLVDHGFRLPSCLDNRPLRFEEFEEMWNRTLFVSATPGDYELGKCGGQVVEQVIRPTGLIDPEVEVRSAVGQVADLLEQIKTRAAAGERVLITTLTKRMAEDLSQFIQAEGIRGRYLHSEIDTLERVEIIRELRAGKFDVLVGVNLLREGLDLPEVSLVAILDADKEGFLRNETSLVQTIGRCARNVNAHVVLYADQVTSSMQRAISETHRRRTIQQRYNEEHGITPETIRKAIRSGLEAEVSARKSAREAARLTEEQYDQQELLRILEEQMLAAAEALEFERAAELRDRIKKIEEEPQIVPGGTLLEDGNRSGRAETAEADAPTLRPRRKSKPSRRRTKR